MTGSTIESGSSLQEKDLALFLESLGSKLPTIVEEKPDGYVVLPLSPVAASTFESRDNKVVLLGYRINGRTYPLSIHFLSGDEKILFGHSTLLLDSYGSDGSVSLALKEAMTRFFSHDGKMVLRTLEPSWENASLTGQDDRRIAWHVKPTLRIAVEVLTAALGMVPEIPIFPSVYFYDNPYVENLLEVGLPELSASGRVLVIGTGSGIEAVCIASKYKVFLDATDINPVAVVNTQIAARRCRVEKFVRSYVSDGFSGISGKFNTIFFEAPLATDKRDHLDINRCDCEGNLLRRVFADLPAHLLPGGRMFLMSRPDLSPYLSSSGIHTKIRRCFEAKSSVAIHEIRLEPF